MALGLLPINLFIAEEKKNEYILLNGGQSDFCLELFSSDTENDYFSTAWSSDAKNYVVVNNDYIYLYNWKNEKKEPIKRKIAEDHFSEFYNYLLSSSFRSDDDIVPFVLNFYRKLRNLTDERNRGKDALNLLFWLFAIYEENIDINRINREKWALNELSLKNSEFERYKEEFSSGIRNKLRPNVELILRHASGILFQEAHKEALFFDRSLDLFSGTLSSQYAIKNIPYSSIHYTPAYLARTIVENALQNIDLTSKKELKVLDPACGTSEFLMELLKQLKYKDYKGIVKIYGLDTSEIAINTSKFLLNYEKREWNDKLYINIELAEDSLIKNWGTDYDLILMNPPFLSWELLNKQKRDVLKNTLNSVFEIKPNLASAFFYKAINSIKENGVIGCVIPSSILTLDSYSKLRNSLSELVTPILIAKLGNFVFENAFTDVSIYIAKKTILQSTPLILWTMNNKGIVSDALRGLRKLNYDKLPLIKEKEYSIYTPIKFPINKENWRVLSYNENNIFKELEILVLDKKLTRIQKIFNVKQGIRTGNNNVFKISENDYNNLPNSEKIYFRPAIDNKAIKNGYLEKKNYIWYPYNLEELIMRSCQ